MTENSFLARNLTLVVGVSLPLLLVLLFWVAMIIPRMTVADPQYDLVLTSTIYNPGARQLSGSLSFEVRDGQLFARYQSAMIMNRAIGVADPVGVVAPSIPVPRLYYFDSASGNLQEITFELPEEPEQDALYPVELPGGGTLTSGSTAPDGYSFDNSYRGSRGFLFFGGGYRYGAKIEKNGRAVKIPSIDSNDYYGLYTFVAWAGPGDP